MAKVLQWKIVRVLLFLFKPGKKFEQRFQGGSSQAAWILALAKPSEYKPSYVMKISVCVNIPVKPVACTIDNWWS